MLLINHDYSVAIFQTLLSFNILYSTCVGRAYQVDGGPEVQHHHAPLKVMNIALERLG